jgi:hypothetical protein
MEKVHTTIQEWEVAEKHAPTLEVKGWWLFLAWDVVVPNEEIDDRLAV